MTMKKVIRFAVAAAIASAAGGAVAGPWEVVKESLSAVEATKDVARVENDEGHMLKIYRDGNDVVHGDFYLKPGLAVMDDRSCPTYRIDGQDPFLARFGGESCRMQARAAVFTLGRVEGTELRSVPVMELMNGTRLKFIYHTKQAGYRETEFTLRGSKQALNAALGPGVRVVE